MKRKYNIPDSNLESIVQTFVEGNGTETINLVKLESILVVAKSFIPVTLSLIAFIVVAVVLIVRYNKKGYFLKKK